MSTGKVLRTLEGENKTFAELMDDVAKLPPQKQEKLTLFVQGYVAAAEVTAIKERNKEAI